MPSQETVKLLEAFSRQEQITGDCLPEGVELRLLQNAIDSKWINASALLPPGREPDYPHGLMVYSLSSSGREVLNEARDEAEEEAKQDRKQKRRAFWNVVKFWVGLLVGWALGGFTPKEVFEWAEKLFQ